MRRTPRAAMLRARRIYVAGMQRQRYFLLKSPLPIYRTGKNDSTGWAAPPSFTSRRCLIANGRPTIIAVELRRPLGKYATFAFAGGPLDFPTAIAVLAFAPTLGHVLIDSRTVTWLTRHRLFAVTDPARHRSSPS